MLESWKIEILTNFEKGMGKDPRQSSLFELPTSTESGPTEPKVKRPFEPIWTENKAKLIERYLYYFVLITKHGTYIDGFGGPQKFTKPETWAAKLVLENQLSGKRPLDFGTSICLTMTKTR